MKKLLPLLILLTACNQDQHHGHEHTHEDMSAQAKQEIIKAENDMSRMAVSEGFNKALLAFAGDSLIKPSEGENPILGKTALEKHWGGKVGTKEISWVPVKAEAAMSGDIGYTFGNWTMVTKDTTLYGNYFTIWKKQSDGTWKWYYDGGNNTPAPN